MEFLHVFFVKTPEHKVFIDNVLMAHPEIVTEGRENKNVLKRSTISWIDEFLSIPEVDEDNNIIHSNGEYYCIAPDVIGFEEFKNSGSLNPYVEGQDYFIHYNNIEMLKDYYMKTTYVNE